MILSSSTILHTTTVTQLPDSPVTGYNNPNNLHLLSIYIWPCIVPVLAQRTSLASATITVVVNVQAESALKVAGKLLALLLGQGIASND
jgi:hypothetical protein